MTLPSCTNDTLYQIPTKRWPRTAFFTINWLTMKVVDCTDIPALANRFDLSEKPKTYKLVEESDCLEIDADTGEHILKRLLDLDESKKNTPIRSTRPKIALSKTTPGKKTRCAVCGERFVDYFALSAHLVKEGHNLNK